jgi:hypothetical protein
VIGQPKRFLGFVRVVAITGSLLNLGQLTGVCSAQENTLAGQPGPSLMIPAGTVEAANAFEMPGGEYRALPLGAWLLYPSFSVGAVSDDNISQTRTNQVSGVGIRVEPSLVAKLDDGIYNTTVYGTLDDRAYVTGDPTHSNSLAANAGFSQTYEAMADLVFKLNGDFTRQKDLFQTFGSDYGATNLNSTGVGLAPVTNPQSYNQFAGAASVGKTWDSTFLTLTGSAVDIVYDDASIGAPSPNVAVYTAAGRAGQWLNPTLYLYGEASADERRYIASALDSHGYRTVVGLGFDQVALFRGEIYGGYQAELYDSGAVPNVGSAAFGGRLSYLASADLTLSASVDRSLGVSALPALTSTIGASTIVTTSLLRARYMIAEQWSASARFGYIQSDYVGSPELDNAWTAGATLSYSLWQNVSLTLDCDFMQKSSNVVVQNFTRNVVTLGASYQY